MIEASKKRNAWLPTLATNLIRAAFVIFCFALAVHAQADGPNSPDRGFHPSASYALGNIETINTTNGNVMLNIPLASLPAGRGGSPGFQLVLRYNSKIWDGQPDVVENPNNPNQMMDVTWLVPSDQGGWNYNLFRFNIFPYNRNSENVTYPTSDCRHWNIWKLKVTFPDGSMRDFRPYGFDDQCNDNYFTVLPTAGMSYFSTDGTYARIDFGANGEWTLRFADGTKVVNTSGLQRTYDRNGNYTEIQDVSNYNGSGHPATVVTDQLGRTIAVEHTLNEDYVYVKGVNGTTLTTTVKWGETYVKKMYRAGNHFQYNVNIDNWGVRGVKEIDLPSQLGTNQKFLFGYNGWPTTGNTTNSVGWGELSSLTLPSGAVATYQYDMNNASGSGLQAQFVLKNTPTRKDLNYNLEYDGTTTAAPTETWLYSINDGSATITAPDGGITTELFTDIDSGQWNSGLVYKTTKPDGTVIEKVWRENRPFNPPGVSIVGTLGVNTFIEKETTSVPSGGTLVKTATKEFKRDKNGNITQVKEYDWVPYGTAPTSADLKRVTNLTYYAATPDASDSTTNDPDSYDHASAPVLLNARASVEIGNGSLTLSRNEFFYDNALTTGNLTQQKNWDSTKGAYTNPLTAGNSISVTNQYDSYGNRTSAIDPRGFETKFTYGTVGSVTDLYPTSVVKAFGTTIQRTTTMDYDFNTGLVKLIRDADNDVNQETDYDALGRPIEMRFAANIAAAKTVTRIEYSAVDRRVIMRSDLNTAYDGAIVTVQHLDQMSRVRLDRRLEDPSQDATVESNGIKVQTRYGFTLGNSYEVVSNPYRAATSSAAGAESTMGWTRRTNDKVGRVVEMKTFGGSTLPAPWDTNAIGTGAVTTAYDANFITVTEQSGAANLRVRRTVTNALNQITRVDEQDKTYVLGTTDAPVQATSYGYNALGFLVNVTQGVQTRTYNYSSLGRLTSSITPESGNTSYQFDNNGNIKQKTDARSITTTYGDYDALNRPTTRSYSDGTPTVTFGYDAAGVDYGKGRLTSATSSAAGYAITDYNPFGLALGTSVTIGSQPYTVSYTYNLRGQLKTLGYPSGRSVTTTYDITGRPSTVAGTLGDTTPRTYSTGITYSADGQMQQEQFGTTAAIYNKRFYNAKNDLAEIRTSTAPNNSDWNRGAIINHYSDSCGGVCTGVAMPDNNGSVRKQEIKIPADDQISSSDTFLQTFSYDSLNRLEVSSENKNGGATQWQQTFNYDRFGNRSIKSSGTFGQDINNMQASVVDNTTTNRIYGPGETEQNHPLFNYDAAGNQTKDYYSAPNTDFDRTFDAENRLTLSTAIGPSGTQNSTYVYDDMGQRVRRNINGVETWQIFGLDGALLAEYAANTAAGTPLKEYGYRRDELLVVAATTGASAPPPSSLTASASGAQVSLSWSAASGAVNYRLERKAAGGSYVLAATTTSTSKVDTGVTAGNAYLYRVCAANAGGSCTSPFSNIALGAAITFATDPTIVSTVDDPTGATATTIKPAHITELRTAVDAVRTLAGLPNASWTNSVSSGVVIRKEDIQDLRDRLADAYNALGITPFSYTDPVLASGSSGTPIKKVHITQLRQSVTSGVGGAGGGGSTLEIRWLVTDQVGTPRMVFSESGTLATVTRHDYLPFGEEILGTTGGRSTTMGYTANDNVRQKFQSKERDAENELEFFEARYYSRLPGRFISPDPLGGHSEDPQTLNRYAFVRNNPLSLTDPTGMDFYLTCSKESDTCKNGQVGKTIDGKFVVTIIKNDKDGKLVDQYGNVYTAKVTPAGVLFNGAGSQEYVLGVFKNGTSPTTIVGNGDMAGFTFNFTMSNLDVNQTAKGTYTYQGTAKEAMEALARAGYGEYFGDNFNFYHPSTPEYKTREFRSPGDEKTAKNSGHFTVHVPVTYIIVPYLREGWRRQRVPNETAPGPSKGDVHFGETNGWSGGAVGHSKELTWPF